MSVLRGVDFTDPTRETDWVIHYWTKEKILAFCRADDNFDSLEFAQFIRRYFGHPEGVFGSLRFHQAYEYKNSPLKKAFRRHIINISGEAIKELVSKLKNR